MKENVKISNPQEHQVYVPARVKVIEVTAQRVLCGSTQQYENEEVNPWL